MRRWIVIATACLLFSGISSQAGWAQEMAIGSFSGTGARAMGMGGAYLAIAEDFTATYWNPAGLAQIRRVEAHGSLSRQTFSNDATYFGTGSSDELSNTRLDGLGVVLPYPAYRGSLVFALGFVRTHNFDSSVRIVGYSDRAEFHKEGRAKDEGGLGVYTLAGAIDVSPSASLGLSVNIWDGKDEFSQRLTSTDVQDVHPDTSEVYERLWFSDEYDGVNLKLGALVRGPGDLRFGATISTWLTYEISEDWEEESRLTPSDEDEGSWRGDFSYKVRLPLRFGVGASWSPGNLTLGAGMEYSEWKQTSYAGSPPFEDATDEEFEERYENTFRYHLGAELALPPLGAKLRAGYYSDPIPFVGPRGEGEPEISIERDRRFLSVGAGMLIDEVLDLNVAYVFGGYNQTEGQLEENVDIARLFVSAAYRW